MDVKDPVKEHSKYVNNLGSIVEKLVSLKYFEKVPPKPSFLFKGRELKQKSSKFGGSEISLDNFLFTCSVSKDVAERLANILDFPLNNYL